jgi:hypothetical protein
MTFRDRVLSFLKQNFVLKPQLTHNDENETLRELLQNVDTRYLIYEYLLQVKLPALSEIAFLHCKSRSFAFQNQ